MPTVLLTGYATPEATEHAEELEIPILFKPIDIKELLDTISELLKENYEQHKAAGEDGSQDQGRKKRGAKVASHRDGSSSSA